MLEAVGGDGYSPCFREATARCMDCPRVEVWATLGKRGIREGETRRMMGIDQITGETHRRDESAPSHGGSPWGGTVKHEKQGTLE